MCKKERSVAFEIRQNVTLPRPHSRLERGHYSPYLTPFGAYSPSIFPPFAGVSNAPKYSALQPRPEMGDRFSGVKYLTQIISALHPAGIVTAAGSHDSMWHVISRSGVSSWPWP